MQWSYLPVRDNHWQNYRLLPVLAAALLFVFSWRFLPLASQAKRLAGEKFLLSGHVLSSRGSQAVVRQANGVRILLLAKKELEPGSLVQGMVQAQRTKGRQNPGGFSEKSWALGQGIMLKAWQLEELQLEPARGLARTRSRLASLRQYLARLPGRHLPEDEAALLSALLLGDSSGLDKNIRFDFNQAGLAHLTALSGLHLGCILLPLRFVLRKLGVRSPGRYLYLLLFLFLFACLAGWQASLSRAVVMTSLPLLGRLLLRGSNTYYCLGLAFFLILLFNPFAVFQLGFWLSFTATAGVLGLARPLSSWLAAHLPVLPRAFIEAAAVSFVAQLATLPLLLASGKSLSLISCFFNIPAGFLTSLILWLGLVFLPLALVSFALPVSLTGILGRLLRLLLQLAAWLARQRSGRIFLFQACLGFLLASFIIWLYQRFQNRTRPVFQTRLLVFACLLCLSLCASRLAQPPVVVYFFSVGQGDAILIRSRWGKSLLLDGGNPGQGKEVLIPALDALGISRPALVIASHGHADHVGGLVDLAEYGLVRRLLLPAGLADNLAPDDAQLAKLLNLLKGKGAVLQTGAARDTIAFNNMIRLHILAPEDTAYLAREAKVDGNAWSLLILAELSGGKLLLTGDCTGPAERRLVWPRADVLKVAHHGSAATTSPAMLAQARPRLAVISVGTNSYGHPAEVVLDNLVAAGCRVYRTDQAGAVVLGFGRSKISTRTYADR